MGQELPSMRAREVVAILKRAGFVDDRQKGSHLALAKGSRTATVPMHPSDLPKGTIRSIIDQAGMTVDEFLVLR